MVDLFKKKGESNSKPAKPKAAKKPLFGGKKSVVPNNVGADNVNIDDTTQQPTKKTGFGGLSSGKKAAPVDKGQAPAKKSLFGTAKVAKAPKATKNAKAPMNTRQLVMVVIALLLVALGIAAKMFLAGEPEVTETPTATVALAPEAQSEPQSSTEQAAPTEMVAETKTPVTSGQPAPEQTVSEQSTAISEQPAPETAMLPTEVVPAAQNTPETTSKPTEKISYDEFIEQSKNRVYRERSTSPVGQ